MWGGIATNRSLLRSCGNQARFRSRAYPLGEGRYAVGAGRCRPYGARGFGGRATPGFATLHPGLQTFRPYGATVLTSDEGRVDRRGRPRSVGRHARCHSRFCPDPQSEEDTGQEWSLVRAIVRYQLSILPSPFSTFPCHSA